MKKKFYVIIFTAAVIYSCAPKTIKNQDKGTDTMDAGMNTAIVAGEKIYVAKCGNCHDLVKPESRTADKWPGIIDWMAPKAKLTDTEKSNVLAYVKARAKKG